MMTWNRRPRARGALFGMILASAAGLSSCASSPQGASGERLYVGWVRFIGEFVLYADPKAFANSETRRCVSGALPAGKQAAAAAQLNGKRVRVRGRLVPWSLPTPDALTLDHEGTRITNWCGDKMVLFASEMRLEEAPSSDP